MIKEFVEQWGRKKDRLRQRIAESRPDKYKQLVEFVAEIMDEGKTLEPSEVFEFWGSDYQGNALYVLRGKNNTYQGDCFYTVKVDYGSCSGCDTLQSIIVDFEGDKQLDQYMNLCLHIVQELKEA
jgi:hypothetical protein